VAAKQGTLRALAILSLIAGCLLGALTIWRLVVAAVHFMQGNSINPWFLLIQAWFLGLTAYLIFFGLGRIRRATKDWKKTPKIGWGKVLLGAFLIISCIANLLHTVPNRMGRFQFKPSNEREAEIMKKSEQITYLTLTFVGVVLIVSGIRARFKKPTETAGSSSSIS
jgi:hypothetical protein